MTRHDRQAQRQRAREVRAGLRLVVPPPKVEGTGAARPGRRNGKRCAAKGSRPTTSLA